MAHFGAPPPRRHLATCSDANHRSKWSFLRPTLGHLRPVAISPLCSDANRRSKWSFCWPTLGHLRPVAKSPLCSDANHRSKWSFCWPTLGRLRPVAKSALVRTLIIIANACFYGPLRSASAPLPNCHFLRR